MGQTNVGITRDDVSAKSGFKAHKVVEWYRRLFATKDIFWIVFELMIG